MEMSVIYMFLLRRTTCFQLSFWNSEEKWWLKSQYILLFVVYLRIVCSLKIHWAWYTYIISMLVWEISGKTSNKVSWIVLKNDNIYSMLRNKKYTQGRSKAKLNSSGSRIWSRGGPRIFFRDFADIAKRSWAIKANNIIFQYTRIWEFLQICSFFFSLQVH